MELHALPAQLVGELGLVGRCEGLLDDGDASLERTSSPCPLPPKSIGGSSRVFLKTQAVEGSCEEIVGCW